MPSKPSPSKRRLPPGIVERHSRYCPTRTGGACNAGRKDGCQLAYRAAVYNKRTHEKERQTFSGPGALAAAKQWRADALSDLGRSRYTAPTRVTLREIADEWLAGAKAEPPTVLNRSELPYKPSVLRGYEADLKRYVLDDFGGWKLTEIRRGDLQKHLVDRLRGDGLGPSKIRNIVVAVRVLFRYAIERDYCEANPTSGLRLGNGIGRRERAASAAEAADLLAALPQEDRALWATAFYAGLRRGELRALRWDDVDLANGIITVRHGWDDYAGEILPKSAKSTDRTTPIIAILRDYLTEAKARTNRDGRDFVFGATPDRPFTPSHIRRRAAKAWEEANAERTEKKLTPLDPIGLHECRHTFVSVLHDAGLTLERIGDYVGHSSTYMTDRYRHLLEGHEAESARMIDAYLARADSRGRIEQLDGEATAD